MYTRASLDGGTRDLLRVLAQCGGEIVFRVEDQTCSKTKTEQRGRCLRR